MSDTVSKVFNKSSDYESEYIINYKKQGDYQIYIYTSPDLLDSYEIELINYNIPDLSTLKLKKTYNIDIYSVFGGYIEFNPIWFSRVELSGPISLTSDYFSSTAQFGVPYKFDNLKKGNYKLSVYGTDNDNITNLRTVNNPVLLSNLQILSTFNINVSSQNGGYFYYTPLTDSYVYDNYSNTFSDSPEKWDKPVQLSLYYGENNITLYAYTKGHQGSGIGYYIKDVRVVINTETSRQPYVQFDIKDDLTGEITDKGYTLENFKFRFEVLSSSIPNYISDYNFVWQFGDGEYSTELTPTHWYKAPGDYTVSLELFGINDINKYVSFKNNITKTVHIYNYTPGYEYNSYNDFIQYIDVQGLSSRDSQQGENFYYYWNKTPIINFKILSFNSWQTYEVNNGINKINLNVTQSKYPLLKPDVYNSNLYLHLAPSDKFLDLDDQPINSITLTGKPIYITRDLSGNVLYVDDIPGATFIGTSAIGQFKYSGTPYYKDEEPIETIIEVSNDGSGLRVNYDIDNNINNTFEHPIMLTKPYGFSFYNVLSGTNSSDLNGFITSSGVNSVLFNIYKYKYINLPINFIFRYTYNNYPLTFINNLNVKNKNILYYNEIEVGTIYLMDSDDNEVAASLYDFKFEQIQQPEPYDSNKGGYLKGILIYFGPDELKNCYIEVTINYDVINEIQLSGLDIKTIKSSQFNILKQDSIQLRKINENFSLAEQYHKNNLQPTLKSLPYLDNFVDTLFGNVYDPNSFTVKLYEKISNYISNINDIDTCNVDALYDHYHMVDLYITNLNYIYPPNLRRIIDLFSISFCKLKGAYNYYNLDFNDKGYTTNLYGKNKGKLLDINTYNITAGVPIIAKEKFSNKYSLINTNLITKTTVLSELNSIYPGINKVNNDYIYPLKEYKLENNNILSNNSKKLSDIGWGWNLILPSRFNLSDYYEFYEYIEHYSGEILDNTLDFDNIYNTIQLNNIDTLDDWEDIKTNYISQTLYNNLIPRETASNELSNIPVTDISIISREIIDSGYLNYKVLPENATNKSVKFEII